MKHRICDENDKNCECYLCTRHEALVVNISSLFLQVELDPIVKSYNLFLTSCLANKHVLEARRVLCPLKTNAILQISTIRRHITPLPPTFSNCKPPSSHSRNAKMKKCQFCTGIALNGHILARPHPEKISNMGRPWWMIFNEKNETIQILVNLPLREWESFKVGNLWKSREVSSCAGLFFCSILHLFITNYMEGAVLR